MRFFKDLRAALLNSTDKVTAPVMPTKPAAPERVEEKAPIAAKKESVVTPFEGVIQSGTELTVLDSQFLVALKDGAITEVFPAGVHRINDQRVPVLASSKLYYINMLEKVNIKWDTQDPINFYDSEFGQLSLIAGGTYGYRICDPVKFIMDYMNFGASISVEAYLGNLLINAVKEIISQNNNTSYKRLPMIVTNAAVEARLADTGIAFAVRIESVGLVDQSPIQGWIR